MEFTEQVEVIRSKLDQNQHFSKTRLQSLYRDFSDLEELNFDGYEANLAAWTSLIHDIIKDERIGDSRVVLSTTSPDLIKGLTIPVYGWPRSIGLVLNHLVIDKRELVPLKLFLECRVSYHSLVREQNGILGYLLPSHWLYWGLNELGVKSFTSTTKAGKLKGEQYVSWGALCEIGNSYRDRIRDQVALQGYTETLFDDELLYELVKTHIDKLVSRKDFQLLLVYLVRDLQVLVSKEVEGNRYLKVLASEKVDRIITDNDICIVQLKASILRLEKRLGELEEKELSIKQKIRTLLNTEDKSTTRIKNAIRLKNLFKSSSEKVSDTLQQLYKILTKINEACFNKNVVDLLGQSSTVLKHLNEELNLDRIESLKEDLDQAIGDTDEITQALTLVPNNESDSELEEELNKLKEQELGKAETVDPKTTQKLNKDDNTELLRKLDDLKLDHDSVSEADALIKKSEPIAE